MHKDSDPPVTYCGTCSEKIQNRHKFVNCSTCKSKIHIKCNNIEYYTYHKMKKDKVISMCTKCNENLPFHNSKDYEHRNFNQEFFASNETKMFFKGLNDHKIHSTMTRPTTLMTLTSHSFLIVSILTLNPSKSKNLITINFQSYTLI